jgi:hypothetical protein
MQTVSEAAAYTLQFINQTQRSVFLTERQGRKDHSLKEIIATTHKNTVVVVLYSRIERRWCHDSLYVSIAV